MGDASSLGFGHFIAQSDIVAKVLLAVLAIMSAISWYLIVYKGSSQLVRQKRSAKFLTFFWSAQVAQLAHLRQLVQAAYLAQQRNEMGGTMRQLFDIVATIAAGAAVLFGIGLMITFSSPMAELVALR